MSWTPERKEVAYKLWADGWSAGQIARHLACGLSRNAVIGVLHRAGKAGRVAPTRPASVGIAPRLRQQTRADPVRRARALHNPTRAKAAPKPRLLIVGDGVMEHAEPRPPLVVIPERHEAPGTATILTIGPRMCRWPIGDPRDESFTLCGCRTDATYCGPHTRRAVQVAQPGRPRTAKELERSVRRYA